MVSSELDRHAKKDIKNLPLKDYEAAVQKKLAERESRLKK